MWSHPRCGENAKNFSSASHVLVTLQVLLLVWPFITIHCIEMAQLKPLGWHTIQYSFWQCHHICDFRTTSGMPLCRRMHALPTLGYRHLSNSLPLASSSLSERVRASVLPLKPGILSFQSTARTQRKALLALKTQLACWLTDTIPASLCFMNSRSPSNGVYACPLHQLDSFSAAYQGCCLWNTKLLHNNIMVFFDL